MDSILSVGSAEHAPVGSVGDLTSEARKLIRYSPITPDKVEQKSWDKSPESVSGYIVRLSHRIDQLNDSYLATIILEAARNMALPEPRTNIARDLVREVRRDPRIHTESAQWLGLLGYYCGACVCIALTELIWLAVHVVAAAEGHASSIRLIYGLPIDRYVVAAVSGVAGAFVALSREPDAGAVPNIEMLRLVVVEIRRPIVGYLLGIVALAAVSSGLIPLSTTAHTAPYWTALLGFAAGLSGKFALSLTKRIERAA